MTWLAILILGGWAMTATAAAMYYRYLSRLYFEPFREMKTRKPVAHVDDELPELYGETFSFLETDDVPH